MVTMTQLSMVLSALLLPHAVHGGSFTVKTDDPDFDFMDMWTSRQKTTKTWLPVCYMYDFLQGSGFFPMSWYDDAEVSFSQSGTTRIATYETTRCAWASLCGARADLNHYRIIYEGTSGSSFLEGYFRIVPDHSAETTTTIKCGPQGVVDASCAWDDECPMVCEDAVLNWTGVEDVEVTVIWQPE